MYHRHDEERTNWEPGGVRSGGRGPQVWSESGVVRIIRDLGSNVLPAALEAVAIAIHLQDVDVVGETVQQRPGEPFRTEHVSPFVKGQVGGDQDGAPLIALTEDLEAEFRAGGDRGTKPNSSMISSLRRASCRWRLSSRRSSLASMSSWTNAAAVVKPTDIPLGRRPDPGPGQRGSGRRHCCRWR